MPDLFRDRLRQELDALKQQGRYRSLRRTRGVNFGSNDYLGFAVDTSLRERALQSLRTLPLSSSSSRLLPGHHELHEELERTFAAFVNASAALYFSSGYAANLSLVHSLATRHDLVLYDERAHASWYDAVHSSHATCFRFKHNDVEDLSRKLQGAAQRERQIFVVIESVYSMDGDLASVQEIARIANAAGAILIVDEAHATGVVGPLGRGLAADVRKSYPEVMSVHTCGKALGSAGAVVAATPTVIEYLVNVARPFIFTTALPPLLVLQTMHAVEGLQRSGDELTSRLRDRSVELRKQLRARLTRWEVPEGTTPIIPVIIGDNEETLSASRIIADAGFDVPAIRPPTVPVGTSRLRLNISLTHSNDELSSVADVIVNAERLTAL